MPRDAVGVSADLVTVSPVRRIALAAWKMERDRSLFLGSRTPRRRGTHDGIPVMKGLASLALSWLFPKLHRECRTRSRSR